MDGQEGEGTSGPWREVAVQMERDSPWLKRDVCGMESEKTPQRVRGGEMSASAMMGQAALHVGLPNSIPERVLLESVALTLLNVGNDQRDQHQTKCRLGRLCAWVALGTTRPLHLRLRLPITSSGRLITRPGEQAVKRNGGRGTRRRFPRRLARTPRGTICPVGGLMLEVTG